MKDYLVRATAAGGQIRALAVVTTNLVDEARQRHKTYPVATAALGRTLTGALLLGATLAEEDILTVRILGDGPLGAVVATANGKGQVRGYVQEPFTHLPSTPQGKLDVGGAVGREGQLYVTKDIGLREPYTGSVPLTSGEIGDDLTYYLTVSEQVNSSVGLGVLVETDNSVRAAGGYIIQLLPGYEEETVSRLEENLLGVTPVSTMVDEGKSPEEMLKAVLMGLDINFLETKEVSFSCPCSKERLEKVLISLGREEIVSMIEEQGGVELTCHFCCDVYNFSKEELENLIAE